jgi:hypothetical protein
LSLTQIISQFASDFTGGRMADRHIVQKDEIEFVRPVCADLARTSDAGIAHLPDCAGRSSRATLAKH